MGVFDDTLSAQAARTAVAFHDCLALGYLSGGRIPSGRATAFLHSRRPAALAHVPYLARVQRQDVIFILAQYKKLKGTRLKKKKVKKSLKDLSQTQQIPVGKQDPEAWLEVSVRGWGGILSQSLNWIGTLGRCVGRSQKGLLG